MSHEPFIYRPLPGLSPRELYKIGQYRRLLHASDSTQLQRPDVQRAHAIAQACGHNHVVCKNLDGLKNGREKAQHTIEFIRGLDDWLRRVNRIIRITKQLCLSDAALDHAARGEQHIWAIRKFMRRNPPRYLRELLNDCLLPLIEKLIEELKTEAGK